MFEDYLKDQHADQYAGTDDNMSDDFESWLEDLDTEELLTHADDWMNEHLERVNKVINKLNKVIS